ncbi:hypothetical protein EDC04DRAFT_2864884 [Pisolithus marmoratus]|nr:hypothetical protein EDC04DRAFT_2864884 [Pisolithus marmoratus]
MPAIVCTAKASYKKQPGTLELSDTHLQWTQDGKKAPSVQIPLQDAASRKAQRRFALSSVLVGDDAGHNFTFSSEPQAVAQAERETFKSELTNVISRNRSGTSTAPPPPAAVTPKAPVTTSASLASSKPNTPVTVAASRASVSRATSVASDGRSSIIPGADAASDFRLRKKVLMSNPELLTLHKDLVMTGQITESEFWEGREPLRRRSVGRPGQLVDPRPQTVEGGEVKIVITPQLVHDIFEEYPVVAKAYSDNVPSKLSEAEFWKRYFQSKLFNAHRASIRSSATQHVVKDDPIFDKYLEKDDDGMEPKRPREAVADLFVSLGATLEDHAETGNEKDITMRAGRQRGVLPLIRKFNDHSERLLNSTLGDNPPFKRRRADGDGQDSFSLIELEDLHDPESSTGIFLEMQDRQRYFEGQLTRGVAAEQAPVQPVDVSAAYADFRRELEGWDVRFNQLRLERKAADAALLSMTQNVTARLDTKAKKNSLPVALFRQVTTCQTAANEFLRQFWGATCPPPIDTPFAPSPAQRSAKAAKMASYLAGTREKVDALVRAAQAEGIDGTSVEVAMKPVLDAVEHALAFYRAKNPSRAIQHKVA